MSESYIPDSPPAVSGSAGNSNGKAASPLPSPGEEAPRPASPPAALAPILRRPVGPKSRRPPTQLLQSERESAASSTASADDSLLPESQKSATPPPAAVAAVLRRPIGPKSRRPPTQLLQSQRDTAASSVAFVDELPTQQEAAEEEAEAEKAASDPEDAEICGMDLNCDPVAEVQDEELVAPSAAPRPRNLPHGAVPMLPGFGGGIGLLKPRLARQRPVPGAGPDGTAGASTASDSAPGTIAAKAEAEAEAPKPRRLRPPGAGPSLPPPPSVAATDLLALRQQLRKTPAAPKTSPPQSPPQSPPSLSSLPRPAPDSASPQKQSRVPPPRPPPPVLKPKPRTVKVADEGIKAASPE